MKRPYNGHESWAAWNVALWIGSDEGLYLLARECKRRGRNLIRAAELFRESVGVPRTRDGAAFSQRSVLLALKGLDE